MKAYTVCARVQASIFHGRLAIQSKKIAKLLKKSERWPNKLSKAKTLEDKPRSGWPFFLKPCEKYYRKSCNYMRNNSTKHKGQNISTSHYRSKFGVQQFGDKLPKKVEKPGREKGSAHFMQAWCQRDLPTLYQRRTAGKLTWCEPPRDYLHYRRRNNIQRSSLKTLDELRQWLRFGWKNVTLGMLWELVHSIPHRVENVRKHTGRHSGY